MLYTLNMYLLLGGGPNLLGYLSLHQHICVHPLDFINIFFKLLLFSFKELDVQINKITLIEILASSLVRNRMSQ